MPSESTALPAAAGSAAAAEVSRSARTTRRGRRPRWRKWLILGAVLLLLRAALPLVVAPLVAARLSRALGARVEVADIGVQPIDAIVTLRGVTVHGAARAGAATEAAAPVVADRVRIDLQWLPLLHRMLEVREMALESARIDLDRFPDGTFGLAHLAPADPARALPQGWTFALDRIAFRDTRLRVRDPDAAGAALADATLRDAKVWGLHGRATAFGKATNLRLDALVGGGRVHVRGRYDPRPDGLALNAVVRVKDVPLAQAASYVADLGWTGLSGRASGQLQWQREPHRRDLLSGRVVLHRASVRVADLGEPALAVRSAVADVSAIDLLARKVVIGMLELRGATLAMRPDARAPVPLLTAALSRPAARGREAGASRTRTGEVSPWSWAIERIDASEGRLRVLEGDGGFEVHAHASGENLGHGAYWSPLRVEVDDGNATAAFDGTVRLADGLGIEGHLTAAGIDVPALARASGLPWAALVRGGRAAADLTVQFESAAGDALPLYVRGDIALTDLSLAGSDPSVFAAGAARVDLALKGLAAPDAGRAGNGAAATRIIFSTAELGAPYALLTRTPDGWMLPEVAPATPAAAGEHPEIVLEAVRGDGGTLTVVDLVPAPAVTWSIARVDGGARNVALSPLTFDGLRVQGVEPRFGSLQLAGTRRAGASRFEVSAKDMPLAATTPYLTLAELPYHFASGTGSFVASGSIGASQWRATAALTLQAPALVDPDESLQRAIGMPVSSALALLRDESGAVAVQMALAPPRADGRGTYADLVAAALRDGLRRAKQAAEAAAAQERAESTAVTILFPPGQDVLTATAMAQLDPVGELLRSRPGLVVELTAETSAGDRRRLTERALGASLEDRDAGFLEDVLRAFGKRDARDRIREALAERARGEPGVLDADDEAVLRRLLAQATPIDDRQLAAVSEARVAQVAVYLSYRHGVAPERIITRGAPPRATGVLPAVRAQIAPARGPAATAGGGPPPSDAGSPTGSAADRGLD